MCCQLLDSNYIFEFKKELNLNFRTFITNLLFFSRDGMRQVATAIRLFTMLHTTPHHLQRPAPETVCENAAPQMSSPDRQQFHLAFPPCGVRRRPTAVLFVRVVRESGRPFTWDAALHSWMGVFAGWSWWVDIGYWGKVWLILQLLEKLQSNQ